MKTIFDRVTKMDKVVKWGIIEILLRLFMLGIWIWLCASCTVYVRENGIQSICEAIWYGKR